MKAVIDENRGRADGKLINQKVRQALSHSCLSFSNPSIATMPFVIDILVLVAIVVFAAKVTSPVFSRKP
jgi:hypothetical protein